MYTIEITDRQISDVFFNYDHPELTAYYKRCSDPKATVIPGDKDAAIQADAYAFAETVGKAHDTGFVDWLVADFLNRE